MSSSILISLVIIGEEHSESHALSFLPVICSFTAATKVISLKKA